jgi:hypothetical protein
LEFADNVFQYPLSQHHPVPDYRMLLIKLHLFIDAILVSDCTTGARFDRPAVLSPYLELPKPVSIFSGKNRTHLLPDRSVEGAVANGRTFETSTQVDQR